MELLIIRLGLCQIFRAILRHDCGGIVRLGHINERVVTGIERMIFTRSYRIVDRGGAIVIRFYIKCRNGVIAGFTEHILQIAAFVRCCRRLVDRLGNRFFLSRGADKERDILRIQRLAEVRRVCTGNSCGNSGFCADLRGHGRGHVDLGNAVAVVFLIEGLIKGNSGRIVTSGRFTPLERLADTDKPYHIAVVKLNDLIVVQQPLLKQSITIAIDEQHKPRKYITVVVNSTGYCLIVVLVEHQPRRFDRVGQGSFSFCQPQFRIDIQICSILTEAFELCGEVIDIGERNCNVFVADKLLAGVFQRLDVLREVLQHRVILSAAADDAVGQISFQRRMSICKGFPRFCAIIFRSQLFRVVLFDQRFGLCLAAPIGFVSRFIGILVDQLMPICRRCRCIDLIVPVEGIRLCRIAVSVIQFVKKCLTVNLGLCIGIPCQRRAIFRADWRTSSEPELVVVPAPIRMERFIERRSINVFFEYQFVNRCLKFRRNVINRCFIIFVSVVYLLRSF